MLHRLAPSTVAPASPYGCGGGSIVKQRIIVVVLMLAAVPLLRAADVPSFFIERIEVHNLRRVSREVVIAESRLREGETYSESELREANDRVARAPYLISAEFALEKGSERGRYVLVINVNEAKPLFFNLDGRPYFTAGGRTSPDYGGDIGSNDEQLAIGYRHFIGSRGAFHAGFEGGGAQRGYTGNDALAVGYTQYDLFGSGAFVTLNVKKPLANVSNYGSSAIVPQLVAGIPLSANQTVTLDYDELHISSRRTPIEGFRGHDFQRLLTARFAYNTTNRPLPTRGTLLTLTPIYARTDQAYANLIVSPPNPLVYEPARTTARSLGLEASAARWFEINDRDSWSAGVEGGDAKVDERGSVNRAFDSRYGLAELTFSHSLWDAARIPIDGDNRVQFDLRLGSRPASYVSYVRFRTTDVRQASVSWVRRNGWGTFRFGAGYAW